jgi:hypothetical protein
MLYIQHPERGGIFDVPQVANAKFANGKVANAKIANAKFANAKVANAANVPNSKARKSRHLLAFAGREESVHRAEGKPHLAVNVR